MRVVEVRHFDEWRNTARELLKRDIPPEEISWEGVNQDSLFNNELAIEELALDEPARAQPLVRAGGQRDSVDALGLSKARPLLAPKAFLDQALYVSCHRSHKRWSVLYRIIWRLNHGEKNLLSIASDADTKQFHHWYKAVKRDRHKMKAFVRFKCCESKPLDANTRDLGDKSYALRQAQSDKADAWYVAWHDPSHFVLPITIPFFVRRFNSMRFVILTPDMSAMWDGHKVSWGEGCVRKEAPQDDDMEELWKTYYANIFNPARIKLKAMQSEMPKKFWHSMPETEVMKQMLREAPARVERMIEESRGKRLLD